MRPFFELSQPEAHGVSGDPSEWRDTLSAAETEVAARGAVLVVDDTPANLVALESVLVPLGQEIVTARNGKEALDWVGRREFAVVLLDVNMPEMNGFETAALIRQRPRTRHTPIIFMSASLTGDSQMCQGYRLGAADYIVSPVVPDILRSKVAVFLALYQQNLELRSDQRRDQAEQALKESNAELEAFAYSVSHDLRAPLRTMQGFAEALLEDCSRELSGNGRHYAERILGAATRMDHLIQDLLVYSRLSHAALELHSLDLHSVIREVLAQLERAIDEANAVISIREPLFEVVAHHSTLVQVLSNLLSNATKFVEAGVQPRVCIRMERCQDWGRLWVEDNGIGIGPEFHARIFRVFERLHGVEAYPGTGVGLAIVRKGAERMGGRVGLESHSGEGSRFWVELPIAKC